MVYIGIDLGTTYSCVSVIENGKPKAIHHDDGMRISSFWENMIILGKNIAPSVVAYGAEILVGNPALNAPTDMSNILYGKLEWSLSQKCIAWRFKTVDWLGILEQFTECWSSSTLDI